MASAAHDRSSTPAWPLALAWTLLIVYASLFPFSDWRWPPGQPITALLVLPWPPWRDDFDLWSNLLGYLPLGLLLAAGLRSQGRGIAATLLLVLAGAAALSYGNELLQTFLPNRHPSLKDWAMNTAGAGAGAVLAVVFDTLGSGRRWRTAQSRWFARRSAAAQSLLALWPFALMFPAPLPLGLGQIFEPLRGTLLGWVSGVPWAAPLADWLAQASAPSQPLGPLSEGLVTALGLLAPCMLAFAITPPGRRRLWLAAGALTLALTAMTVSTLLNFGPRHAFAWLMPATGPALACGALAAACLALSSRRLAAGVGLVAVVASTALVAQAPADPYFAASLLAWEQGRFVRLHGLTQWIAGAWPYLAMMVLLGRLARED